MVKQVLHRNAQFKCYLKLCEMIGKCLEPKMCNDSGYMHFVPPKPTILTHLKRREKCCNQPLAEPCADCPNTLGGPDDDCPF